MEARRVTAKNQIVRDLSPGEVMVFATPKEWEALFKYERQSAIDDFKAVLQSQGVEVD